MKVKDKSETQSRSSFQVQRDWLDRADKEVVAESRVSSASASDSTMMQRWLKDPMREEPYNNIGAVLEKKQPENSRSATNEGVTRDRTV